MKFINFTLIFSLLLIAHAAHASDISATATISLVITQLNHDQKVEIYNTAKHKFETAEKTFKMYKKVKDTIPADLQNEYDNAYRAWYGKPWNDLTPLEKSESYKKFTDPFKTISWNELPKLEKALYNRDNKYLYYGQCDKLWELNQEEEHLASKFDNSATK